MDSDKTNDLIIITWWLMIFRPKYKVHFKKPFDEKTDLFLNAAFFPNS